MLVSAGERDVISERRGQIETWLARFLWIAAMLV